MESSENTYLNGYSQFQQVRHITQSIVSPKVQPQIHFGGLPPLPSTSSAVFCKVQVTGLLVFIYIPGVADTVV